MGVVEEPTRCKLHFLLIARTLAHTISASFLSNQVKLLVLNAWYIIIILCCSQIFRWVYKLSQNSHLDVQQGCCGTLYALQECLFLTDQ